jgi:hypothetical protein
MGGLAINLQKSVCCAAWAKNTKPHFFRVGFVSDLNPAKAGFILSPKTN